MIVRILGEGQFRLSATVLAEIDAEDDLLLDAIHGDDAEGFRSALDHVLQIVREKGQALPIDEIVESDLILPASTMTLEEARHLFDHYPRHLAD